MTDDGRSPEMFEAPGDKREHDEAAPARPAEADQPGAGADGSAMTDIEREVEEAMASMDPADQAELCGDVSIDRRDDTAGHADVPERDGAGPARGAVEMAIADMSERISPGAELTGTVAGVTNDDVFLEFGAKSQGVMPRSQFGKKETLEVGRRVDVVVERYDAAAGLLIVNRKGSLVRATWTNLTVGMITEGRVTGVVKGGLELDLKGIRAFMPGSHADVAPMKDISILLNETVLCEVIELDRRNKNVLLSRRKVLERQQAEAREKLRSELAVGQTRKGVVRTIMDYGAFVDLGGIDGLAHIRDLSWGSVDKVSDVLSPGQEIEVQVLKIDSALGRISLGVKQCQPDPWADVDAKYPVGTALKVRIIRLASFGVFAELEPGVEGLIPISELSWKRVSRVSDVVSPGDVVDAVVIRVDTPKHRIALSVKQARPNPWDPVLESFAVQSVVKGTVRRLADFGVFVELVPGVEGLIHISELSDKRVASCGQVVKVGETVEARVLGVDKENRRISLSIKAVNAPTASEATAPRRAGEPDHQKQRRRKKPLRGGLASHFDW
ncbi:MAG: S1 RNA-binding domain-containing protein [Phycisphaerae bacterium]